MAFIGKISVISAKDIIDKEGFRKNTSRNKQAIIIFFIKIRRD